MKENSDQAWEAASQSAIRQARREARVHGCSVKKQRRDNRNVLSPTAKVDTALNLIYVGHEDAGARCCSSSPSPSTS